MKVIRFTEGVNPYNAGETAGFPEETADYYIAKNWAVALDEDGNPIALEVTESVLDQGGEGEGEGEGSEADLPEGYTVQHVSGGYFRLFREDGTEVEGLSNGKWQGRDAAIDAAQDDAKSTAE